MISIQDAIRTAWARDADLNGWIPATEGSDNRLFEEGADLTGVTRPYAVVVDNGAGGSSSLGDHTFFEQHTFLVRMYAIDREQLKYFARRARLVFNNLRGLHTEDGWVGMVRVSGGQATLFPDGTRRVQYVLQMTVIENRGPSRLRGTTQGR